MVPVISVVGMAVMVIDKQFFVAVTVTVARCAFLAGRSWWRTFIHQCIFYILKILRYINYGFLYHYTRFTFM
jgi:hypothetical protein